jgi:anaerobic selenocysteine-containing dehydrogenase
MIDRRPRIEDGFDDREQKPMTHPSTQRVHGYCGLCIARCGCVAVVEEGRFTRLEPDPAHPTGQALCAKGRAAPELVYHPERLTYPLRRTRPKGDPTPAGNGSAGTRP